MGLAHADESIGEQINQTSGASSLIPANNMQAIVTKIIPATNTKPTRIKATCARGSVTICCDSSSETAHRVVALKLVGKFLTEDAEEYGTPPKENPWGKPFVSGCLPSGNYAHVFTS